MSSMNMCREHKPSLTGALPTQPPGGPQHSSEGAHSFLHGLGALVPSLQAASRGTGKDPVSKHTLMFRIPRAQHLEVNTG